MPDQTPMEKKGIQQGGSAAVVGRSGGVRSGLRRGVAWRTVLERPLPCMHESLTAHLGPVVPWSRQPDYTKEQRKRRSFFALIAPPSQSNSFDDVCVSCAVGHMVNSTRGV